MSSILILGATSDIAVAIARKFAEEKYAIQLAGRDTEQLKPIQSDIQVRYGVDCSIHVFDAVQFSSHEAFFQGLSPKPDITVCVMGSMLDEDKAFHDWPMAKTMIDTNFSGPVSILNIAGRYYSEQKQGTIVGISSVAGERGRQSKLIYGSSKAAFSAYLAGLRNKLFKDKVHVLSVKPGFVYTKMTAELKLPKPLTAQPSEVANAVFKGVKSKKNTVYVKWMWRWIMLIIKNIPEFQFKKMKL
jgi:decaprenylphospho-beta-D-erythro-pentofuranosid-2-ulose 2-reductase